MSSYSTEEILDSVRDRMAWDKKYEDDLHSAIEARNDSWIRRLVRAALGIVVEIGKAVIQAIVGWFF